MQDCTVLNKLDPTLFPQDDCCSAPVSSPHLICNTNNRVIRLNLANRNLENLSLPDDIGSLSELQFLDLFNTKLTSKIPQSIVNLSKLRFLSLADNNFTGELPRLPTELDQCTLTNLGDDLCYKQIYPPPSQCVHNMNQCTGLRNRLSPSEISPDLPTGPLHPGAIAGIVLALILVLLGLCRVRIYDTFSKKRVVDLDTFSTKNSPYQSTTPLALPDLQPQSSSTLDAEALNYDKYQNYIGHQQKFASKRHHGSSITSSPKMLSESNINKSYSVSSASSSDGHTAVYDYKRASSSTLKTSNSSEYHPIYCRYCGDPFYSSNQTICESCGHSRI